MLLHRVEPRDVVDIGVFQVEFIRVSHSLVDCFSLGIKTPVGTIIHTGDYKADETPVIGEPIDLRRFAVTDRTACSRCSPIRRTRRCPAERHLNAPDSGV